MEYENKQCMNFTPTISKHFSISSENEAKSFSSACPPSSIPELLQALKLELSIQTGLIIEEQKQEVEVLKNQIRDQTEVIRSLRLDQMQECLKCKENQAVLLEKMPRHESDIFYAISEQGEFKKMPEPDNASPESFEFKFDLVDLTAESKAVVVRGNLGTGSEFNLKKVIKCGGFQTGSAISEQLQRELNKKDLEIEELKENIFKFSQDNELINQMRSANEEKQLLKDQIELANKEKEVLKDQINQTSKENEALENKIRQVSEENEALKTQLTKILKENQEFKTKACMSVLENEELINNTELHKKKIEELSKKIEILMNENKNIRETYDNTVKCYSDKVEELKKQISDISKRREEKGKENEISSEENSVILDDSVLESIAEAINHESLEMSLGRNDGFLFGNRPEALIKAGVEEEKSGLGLWELKKIENKFPIGLKVGKSIDIRPPGLKALGRTKSKSAVLDSLNAEISPEKVHKLEDNEVKVKDPYDDVSLIPTKSKAVTFVSKSAT